VNPKKSSLWVHIHVGLFFLLGKDKLENLIKVVRIAATKKIKNNKTQAGPGSFVRSVNFLLPFNYFLIG
jgi:hypothetical protein